MKRTLLFFAVAGLLAGGAAAQTAADLFKQGKEALDKYDKLSANFQMEKLKNPEAKNANADEMTELLFDGFAKLQQALPLDTIIEVDKKTGEPKIDKKTGKPKFKAKLSPEIINLLEGHQNDFLNVGNDNLLAEKYANSYRAFAAFTKLKEAKGDITEEQKPIMGEVYFYQGYSAYNLKDFDGAFPAFDKAINYGYKENNVLDFKKSSIANIVQNFVNEKKHAEAIAFIDGELAKKPDGFLYDTKGFVVEDRDGDKGFLTSREFYQKATELDPTFSDSFFNLGKSYYLESVDIAQKNQDKSDKQLAPMVKPLYDKALELFNKAKELGKTDAQRYIDDLQYKIEMVTR